MIFWSFYAIVIFILKKLEGGGKMANHQQNENWKKQKQWRGRERVLKHWIFWKFSFFFGSKITAQKDRGWSYPFFVDRVAVRTIRLLQQSFCSCRADSRNLGWLRRQFLQCFQSRGHWAWDWVLKALWCLRLSEEEGFLAFPFWFSWWIHGPRKKSLNTWIHSCCCEELCNRF